MGRSGYTDNYDEYFPNATYLYQANVKRALGSKRGQAFLKDLLVQMDAMPEKRLVTGELEQGGEVCTLGIMTRARKIDTSDLKFGDDDDDFDREWVIDDLAGKFNIANPMVREIMYMNDEGNWKDHNETPEHRWERMRRWVDRHLVKEVA